MMKLHEHCRMFLVVGFKEVNVFRLSRLLSVRYEDGGCTETCSQNCCLEEFQLGGTTVQLNEGVVEVKRERNLTNSGASCGRSPLAR